MLVFLLVDDDLQVLMISIGESDAVAGAMDIGEVLRLFGKKIADVPSRLSAKGDEFSI